MTDTTSKQLPEEVVKRVTQACYEYGDGQLGEDMPFILYLIEQELATLEQKHEREMEKQREKIGWVVAVSDYVSSPQDLLAEINESLTQNKTEGEL